MGRGGLTAPGSGGAATTYPLDESFNANLLTGNGDEWARLVREAVAWPDLTIGGATFDWVGRALNECARLSRAVSEVFDAADPISGEYLLEVSSPGIDRPLTRLIDFDLFEGYEARLETDRMVEGRKRFKGILAGVEGENVAIDLDGEEDTALIPFEWIADAKLVLTDELLKRGAALRAARGEPEDDGLPEGAAEEDEQTTPTSTKDKA